MPILILAFLLSGCQSSAVPQARIVATRTAIPSPTQEIILSPTSTTFSIRTLDEFPEVPAPSSEDLKAAVAAYAYAIGTNPETVQISYRQITTRQGEDYIVAVTSDGTPLLSAKYQPTSKVSWQPTTLKTVANMAGIDAGISVDGSEPYKSPGYKLTAIDNFNLLMPDGSFAANTLIRWGDQMAADFTQWASESNMRLRILSVFHVDQVSSWGEIKNQSQADAFMRAHLEKLMDPKFIVPGRKTELVVVHESTVQDWGDGTEHWIGQGTDKGLLNMPLWDVYGEEWPVKAYITAYQVAKEKGLKVGEDVVFAMSDYNFLQNSFKAEMIFRMMTRIRDGVAADPSLGMKPDDVRINIIDQTHMNADEQNQRGWQGIYTKDIRPEVIAQNVKKLSVFGDIEGSEIDISGTNDLTEKAEATAAIVNAYLQAGVKSVDFYQILRFDSQKPENYSLFNQDYSRTIVYWQVLRTIFQHIED